MKFKQSLASSLAAIGLCASGLVAAQVDENLPNYQRVSGISGNLSSVGSDTLNNLMTLWAEEFAKFYPNVNIQIQGAGTSTAPPALIEGTSNFGPMSRPMRDSEQRAFEERFGYAADRWFRWRLTWLPCTSTSDNPIEEHERSSRSTRCSPRPAHAATSSDIRTWGDLGMSGGWAGRDITHLRPQRGVGHLRLSSVRWRCVAVTSSRAPSTSSPVPRRWCVGWSRLSNGIGYSGIGYRTSGVRVVPLASGTSGTEYFEADCRQCRHG
jgi:phosphate transport system substrate-binding protein